MSTQVKLRMPAKAEYLLLGRLALSGMARTVQLDPERLVRIDVEDEGTGFQARQIEQWEPDALSEDGMGLAIIRAVVDDLEIGSGPGGRGTRLTLTKRL